jgi:dihydrodipicolinate synthase/N-acetylneuraminate lyase
MQGDKIQGIVPILVTPFEPDGAIDTKSLASLVEFNIKAGVHGLGVAIGSEVFKLNEAERATVIRCVVETAQGRVPIIINTGASGTDLAVHYSKAAEDAGADAVMVIPPYFMPAGADEIVDYYRRISNAIGIPIVLQDVPQAPISPGLALRLAKECEHVRYIKVETLPVTSKVADFVAVWNLYHQGDEHQARAVFDARIMAVNRLAAQAGDIFYHVHKQLLVRQGVIRTASVRSPTMRIDPVTQREIDDLLAELVPSPRPFAAA